jgi:CubicO group peptidase (beta-lactamase class C family)
LPFHIALNDAKIFNYSKVNMKQAVATFITALLSTTLWAAEANVDNVTANTQGFDREVTECAKLLKLPGLSVAIVQDGAIVHRLSLGFADLESKRPPTDESIFWLASVTKSFSAVMMMQYQQEGRISLEDPLIKYPFTSLGFFPQRIDPNVQLKHVLSHTSESTPGTAFVYNGGRYNFIYGVFQQMSGLKFPEAYTHELETRIVQPLGLEATLAGYPNTNQAVVRARIVTPYSYNSEKQEFAVNRDALKPGTAYPASGLLSCVKDLAAYTTALDGDRLLMKASYQKMTSPFICNDGRASAYGLGWFVTDFNGVALHWAYGLGDSDSSILVRVPSRNLSLILLCNSSFATAPSRFGSGNPLTSPFVVSFLKHFVCEKDSDPAEINYGGDVEKIRGNLGQRLARKRTTMTTVYLSELLSQALTRSFTESTFKTPTHQGEALTQLLFDLDREVFTKNDPAIFHLLSLHSSPALDNASKLAIESYNTAGRFHPWILYSIAKRFESRGDTENSMKYFHLLTDTAGFEEQGDKIEAYSIVARQYAKQRDFKKARDYYWRALIYTRQVGGNDAEILKEIDQVNKSATGNEPRG